MRILEGIKGISIVRFDDRDIIRHRLVKSIVKAYNKD
jgi:phosphate starvation-inducible PhoH-like protein